MKLAKHVEGSYFSVIYHLRIIMVDFNLLLKFFIYFVFTFLETEGKRERQRKRDLSFTGWWYPNRLVDKIRTRNLEPNEDLSHGRHGPKFLSSPIMCHHVYQQEPGSEVDEPGLGILILDAGLSHSALTIAPNTCHSTVYFFLVIFIWLVYFIERNFGLCEYLSSHEMSKPWPLSLPFNLWLCGKTFC